VALDRIVSDVVAGKSPEGGAIEMHALQLRLRGRGDFDALLVAIADLKGVVSVRKSEGQRR
jgi:hypothetical protein